MRRVTSMALAVFGLIGYPMAIRAGEQREPFLMGVQLASYECGRSRFIVHAARGYAGRQRVGFFQTALVPTVELEDVTIERLQDNGTTETMRLPAVTVNWLTKAISTPSGKPLLSIEHSSSTASSDGPPIAQGLCQG